MWDNASQYLIYGDIELLVSVLTVFTCVGKEIEQSEGFWNFGYPVLLFWLWSTSTYLNFLPVDTQQKLVHNSYW